MSSRVITLLLCMLSSISLLKVTKAEAKSANELYQTCVACHGQQGQGNDALKAPQIAGQPAWYIERQLNNFITGVRGSHEQDIHGQQMRASVASLEVDKDVPALANYIASLKGEKISEELSGDLMNGSRYYQAKCGACHGGKAEGNKSFNAPKLAGLQISYIQRQMVNFKQGVRGNHKEDKLGKQMAMMAKVVSDKELHDILYYIAQQE